MLVTAMMLATLWFSPPPRVRGKLRPWWPEEIRRRRRAAVALAILCAAVLWRR